MSPTPAALSASISKLLSTINVATILTDLDIEYRRVIEAHERAEVERNRISIDEARSTPVRSRSTSRRSSHRTYIGVRTFDQIDLADLVPYIDWTPVLPHMGAARAIPGDPHRRRVRRSCPPTVRRRPADARTDSDGWLVRAEGRRRLLAGAARW